MFSRRLFCLAAAAVGAALASSPVRADEPHTYNFSPVNQFGVQLTASYWNPIIDYISAKSGVKLVLKVGRTSADTTSYVLAQEVDFAFTNHLFSEERRKMGWKVFGRRDYPPVRSELVVMADSPITDVKQLHEQDVGYAGPEAFVIYKVSYAYLINRGILPHVVFTGNQDGAIAQLRSGKVKAIGANSQLIDGYVKREGISIRKLWSSEPFNDLALMNSPRVPAEDVKAVAKAFMAMGDDPEGKAILKRVSELVQFPVLNRFIPARDDDYQSYFDFYRTSPPMLH